MVTITLTLDEKKLNALATRLSKLLNDPELMMAIMAANKPSAPIPKATRRRRRRAPKPPTK